MTSQNVDAFLQLFLTTRIARDFSRLSRLAANGSLGQAPGMITVEKTETDVRVTIPKDAVPPKQLDAFLDWLRLEEIAQRSRLTEEDANRFADEMKAGWWAANKDKFIPPDKR